jgi:branched-chain amino acid aminotransferase
VAYPLVDEITGRWLSWDGQLVGVDDPSVSSLFQPSEGQMFYEVVRITSDIPLFWEDHMARLEASISGRIPIPPSLYAESIALIAANSIPDANLRIVLTSGRHVVPLTKSYYPSQESRQIGVPTGILAWERVNPNAKIILSDYKAAVAGRFAQPGPFGRCFELLLADRSGCLTEGSRSNLFFIRQNQVLSAPDNRILLGITRKYVRQAIETAGLSYCEEMLTLEAIRGGGCDAAFLTGSPIDVLPIRAIEDIELASGTHPGMRRLMAAYQTIVDGYVAARAR